MKIKKLYKYDRGKQIYRLLTTESDKIIIEERDKEKKEAFFTCLNIQSGKKIFYDFQLEEKYWIGIKEIYKDVILFHRYERPDLPNHKGVIAFDINSQSILWENQSNFLFINNDKIFLSSNEFGIQKIIAVNYLTGEIEKQTKEVITNPEKGNIASYLYSKKISRFEFQELIHPKFKKEIEDYLIKDDINFAEKDDFKFFSFHIINNKEKFNNIFYAVSKEGKVILKQTLNKNIEKIEPESFFIKNDLLFLLFGTSGFGVYKII